MWQRVVVTGAAGFIGGHLCHRLIESGVSSVVGIDSLRSGDWGRVPLGVERLQHDIAEVSVEEWRTIVRGSDVVFHLAAEKYNSSKSTPNRLLSANVLGTEHLFRATALERVPRVVFTSSLYAYGSMGPETMSESDRAEPQTLYGASKLMGENILRSLDREIGLSWNVARLFFIYGPHQYAEGGYKSVILSNFERLLDNEAPVIKGDGEQSLDYVYVNDCVEALVELARSPIDKMIVNVASGNPVSVRELTSVMQEIAGSHRIAVESPPDWTAGSRRAGDPAAIQEHFRWKSTTPMREGLTRVFEWMQASQNA